jgi:hypothetical protein
MLEDVIKAQICVCQLAFLLANIKWVPKAKNPEIQQHQGEQICRKGENE